LGWRGEEGGGIFYLWGFVAEGGWIHGKLNLTGQFSRTEC